MKYRKCEICGLRSERKDGTKRFFMARFPLDEDRCKKWVKATGKEDLAYIPIEKLHQLKFICGKHFTAKDYKGKKTQLNKYAFPSICLTTEPLSDDKLIEFPCRLYKEQQALSKGLRKVSEARQEDGAGAGEDPFCDTEAVEESQEQEIEGPFSWQQPSAVVPCDADILEIACTSASVETATQGDSFWGDGWKETATVPQSGTHSGFHCNECEKEILGFRYLCVQCADFDLCGACEAAGRHRQHYVLRVPPDKTKDEVEAVLQTIRRAVTNCIVHLDDDGLVEVKDELEDELEDVSKDPISVDDLNSGHHKHSDKGDPDDGDSDNETCENSDSGDQGSESSRDPFNDLDQCPIDRIVEKTSSWLKLHSNVKRKAIRSEPRKTNITLVLEPMKTGLFQINTSKEKKSEQCPSDMNTFSGKIVSLPTNSRLPTKSQVISIKSSDLPTKSQEISIKSSDLPTKSQVISIKSSDLPTKSQVISLKSSNLPTKSQVISLKSSNLPTKSQVISLKSFDLTTKSQVISLKSSNLPTKSQMISLKSSDLPTKSQVISLKSSNLPTKSQVISLKSSDLPTKSQVISLKSSDLPTKIQVISLKSPDLPTKSQVITLKSSNLPTKSQVISLKSSDLYTKNHEIPTKSNLIPIKSNMSPIKSQIIIPTKSPVIPSKSCVLPSNAKCATKRKTLFMETRDLKLLPDPAQKKLKEVKEQARPPQASIVTSQPAQNAVVRVVRLTREEINSALLRN